MDALASDDTLLFEGFRLDRRRGCLLNQDKDGAWRPVALGSRALDVLAILADQQGALLSKDEIMAAAWPGTVVEDNNLAVQISALRRILDRDRHEGSCIQTIPGRGYRFVAPVMRTNSAAPPAALSPSGNEVDEHITADEQLQGRPGVPARPDEPPSQASRRPRRGMIAGVIGILFLIAAGVVGWHLRSSGSDETRPAPRLSIVVLPFADLSVAHDQQYFADGVTEDLTTDLSRMAGTLVISADTALTYRNKPVDAKQIGRELEVRYVVEGSLERSGNRVRVNAQLIDAETDTHLWAERFDHEITDLFELQSEITGRIAFAVNLELVGAEANRHVKNPDALDDIFRGREFFFGRPPTPVNIQNAISLYEQALRLDPQSPEAKTYLAVALVNRVNLGFTSSPAVDLARAEKLIDEALAAGTRISWGALCQRHGPAQKRAMGRRDCRVRNRAGPQPQYDRCLAGPRLVQALHRRADRSDTARGESHPYRPARPRHRLSLLDDRICLRIVKSAQRSDWLVRKGAGYDWRRFRAVGSPRLRPRPYRRCRTCRRRPHRSAPARPGQSLFEHRPPQDIRAMGCAKGPSHVRGHLFRRTAQGRRAGAVRTRPGSQLSGRLLAGPKAQRAAFSKNRSARRARKLAPTGNAASLKS